MPIKRFPASEYRGFWILPYSTRRCGKRDYIALDGKPPAGKKIHGGWYSNEKLARECIDNHIERIKNGSR